MNTRFVKLTVEKNYKNFQKEVGFTLAEVLITLGIIGIVAAMTLPALIRKQEKIETQTRLKKVYSLVNQGILRAVMENGDTKNWQNNIDSEDLLKNYISPYFKVDKFYPKTPNWSETMCFDGKYFKGKNNIKTQYVWMDNVHISSPFLANNTASIKLKDGTCIGANSKSSGRFSIFIDVNGSSNKPNKAGYDLFFFLVENNSLQPEDKNFKEEELSNPSITNSCHLKAKRGGYFCAKKIMLDNWEIKYY